MQDAQQLLYKPSKSKADTEKLLSIHKNLVYWCLHRANVAYDADCESAAWEALWDAINKFDVFSSTAFSSFAVRVITNRINDVLRKRKIQYAREAEVPEYYEAVDECSSPQQMIEAADELRRISAIIDDYINTRTGKTKNILIVWRASQFSCEHKAIATICNTSTSTVGKVLVGCRAYIAMRLRDV